MDFLFLSRGERGEGLSGLPVVCLSEPVIGEHLLAVAEASRGEALGTQPARGERREVRGERRERERELRVLRVK